MGDMIDRDAALNIIAGEGLHILDKAIRALPAASAEDVRADDRATAYRTGIDIGRQIALNDAAALCDRYPYVEGVKAAILALIPEDKP